MAAELQEFHAQVWSKHGLTLQFITDAQMNWFVASAHIVYSSLVFDGLCNDTKLLEVIVTARLT